MAPTEAASSPAPPKGATLEEELTFYKEQYEHLETELQDFQASSKELEAELEKDIEASEQRERQLKEKVENLGFEVDEWKAKHRQAKTEANIAQNALQKEVTTLRDTSRSLQLRLRDIEVANDDFEKQARHQTSSLEDLESKYNVAIERGVMFEEEIRLVEQERETLRIDTQRLRDELSDLKIEAEITQEKLRLAEETIERYHTRKPTPLATDSLRPPSPSSEASTSATTVSSPTIATPPPTKSETSTIQTTPPSPPLSDASAKARAKTKAKAVPFTPANKRTIEPGTTPRPSYGSAIRPPRHSRGPSIPATTTPRPAPSTSTAPKYLSRSSRPSISIVSGDSLPRSGSLYQLRGLRTKIQNLEERVHRVQSKLPAPTTTPPRASPRGASGLGSNIPATVTVRSNRKRASGSTATSLNEQSVSRLSFGFSGASKPGEISRPSSRTSVTSHTSVVGGNAGIYTRPLSRTSTIGRPPSQSSMRTPSSIGHYGAAVNTERRPRSSVSGSYSAVHGSSTPNLARSEMAPRTGTPGPRLGHGHSHSMSTSFAGEDGDGFATPVARRTTLEKGLSAIPTPSGLPRRQSGGVGRRQSNVGLPDGGGGGDMPPPASTQGRIRKLSEVGETF